MTSQSDKLRSEGSKLRSEQAKYIFRCDDVSSNTNTGQLLEMYEILEDAGIDFEFWSVVSILSKGNNNGSVYPNPPFKHKDRNFFYECDDMFKPSVLPGRVVSHGLLHCDHGLLQYDAQEMSIVTSCNILNTNIFVPPFNRYNDITQNVCRINKIDLVQYNEGWRNLDNQPFDPAHKLWYFHPWRTTPEIFEAAIDVGVRT